MAKFNEGVWDETPKTMRHEPRPYVCTNCGHRQNISTNHTGNVYDYCKGCSWKPSFGKGTKIPQLGGHTYREFRYAGEVNEKINTMKKSEFKKLIESIMREFDKFDVIHTNENDEEDICGLCGKPGADKIHHPQYWPGEQRPDGKLVHSGCEQEETARAHAAFMNKVGPEGVKQFLRGINENSGYSHGNIGGMPNKSERDPLNDPLLKEYNDPETRKKALISRPNDALKLIYIWSKKEMIDYREFVDLTQQWFESVKMNPKYRFTKEK